jgi:ATP-dependent protease ClpP protease subunit
MAKEDFAPPRPKLDKAALATPNVCLHGQVNEAMLARWIELTLPLRGGKGPLILELSTVGGDAEVGRRIADDVRLLREAGSSVRFVGKTTVYSAGATVMGGFLRTERWLARDAVVMVHGRKLSKSLTFEKALRAERPGVEALLAEIDQGIRIERIEFAKLIEGSDITMDEIEGQTIANWYLSAEEALRRGLIAGIL